MEIILASASAGRKKLLENLGLKFEVLPANIDEKKFKAKSSLGLVKKIARAKAEAVALTLGAHNSCLIIAADSMVVFRGQLYGKPKSRSEAKRLLKMLAGKTHFFVTGLSVIAFCTRDSAEPSITSSRKISVLNKNLDTNIYKLYQASAKTQVIFQNFTDKEIDKYVKTSDVCSHAGAYATGDEFIKTRVKMLGSETNVIGLPLEKLLPILNKLGVRLPK